MPGLKELSQFRNELSKLANERKVVAERGEIYEELPFPPSVSQSAPSLDVDNLLASLGDTSSPADSPPPGDLSEPEPFDPSAPDSSDLSGFDDLLSSLSLDEPEELSSEPEPEPEPEPELPAFEATEPPPAILQEEDDFGVPADLLSGFADDIEESRSEGDAFSLPDFDMPSPGFDSGVTESAPVSDQSKASEIGEMEDLESLEEIGTTEKFAIPDDFSQSPGEAGSEMPEEFAVPEDFTMPEGFGEGSAIEEITEPEELADLSPEELPGEEVKIDNFEGDISDFGEMDFTPSFEFEETAAKKAEAKGGTAELPDLDSVSAPDFGMPEAPPASREDDFSDFSVPDDLNIVESVPPSAEAAIPDLDGFDGFSLDADFLKNSIENASGDSDEFHIPGFSDFTSGPPRPSLSDLPDTAGMPRASAKKAVPLKITEADFAKFLETLGTYPLNLRIAVEEYLAGESGTETHKMGIVHSIIAQTPLRKIAHTLETALDRSIPIPKDYERKTLAEYEREKSSLKYVFLNRILPAAVIFIITATLAFCMVYLSWQFIYRPLAAESLYKRGYADIEDARYSQAIVLFDEAVLMWNKKKWYFKYAQAFRDKKQYISAELMYERILDNFKNDKKAGLEYAEMLRTDMRNFAKAETILKRRLLDFYVNDKVALMLLGDNYLDWAEEDPTKFEEARKTYATLIELYGSQDPYLARMMRYFIRTDKLIQVLPLKERFMSKKAKIGAQDLVELSGYLLEKRYNPAPGDSEYLRNQIEDLKILLTRAIKADDSSPEAYYNMGRFLIFNYKTDLAINALGEALQRFGKVSTMSPKRVLANIDAFRLLGEMQVENMQYLKGQSSYTQGISMYEEQKANRTVRADARIGKLYADYADIDYFISGDFDSAFTNYSKATEELNDTPSVRYRIGYIQYQRQEYEAAMRIFTGVQAELISDKNLLYGFANTLYRRGDYYAAQGYYERLMGMLEAERERKNIIFPQVRTDHQAFVTEYLRTANNLAVTLSRLSFRIGDSKKNARALALLAESTRAWDALTRNQESMVRLEGSNLAFLNIQNMTHPQAAFVPEIYADIPRTLENEKTLKQASD